MNSKNDQTTQTHLNNLWTADRDLQNQAYSYLMEATSQPVDWAYDVWDEVVENLTHKDNHNRAIAAQLLANLAVSDPEGRILDSLEALLVVTRDERTVTARHALLAIWKVGLGGEKQKNLVVARLANRFETNAGEKNYTLVRYDILQALRNLYDEVQDETIKVTALALIETEADPKYRKKYGRLWK